MSAKELLDVQDIQIEYSLLKKNRKKIKQKKKCITSPTEGTKDYI